MQRNQLRPSNESRSAAGYNQRVRGYGHGLELTGGCSSYYLDQNGKNSIGFPWSTYRMRQLLSRFDMASYLGLAKVDWAAQNLTASSTKKTTARRKKATEASV